MDKKPMTPEMRIWVDQSQGMVRSIATKIATRLPAHVNYDDLVCYGQLGLMQAVYSFQPDKQINFQTFAYHRIRGAIYDGLSKMAWTSRAVAQRLRAEKLSAELLEQQVDAARRVESAESLSADADWLVRTTERIAIVHVLTDSADSERSLANTVAGDEVTPEESAEHAELCGLLRSYVDELPETEKALIVATYFEGKTLTEAAQALGKSKSWGSRVHSRILEKLARRLGPA